MKNQKIKIKEVQNPETKFSICSEDFFLQCQDYLSEISNFPRESKEHDDYRNIVLETYFTYKFFCREFNWTPTDNMDYIEPDVLMQMRNKFLDTTLIVSNRFETKGIFKSCSAE